MLFRSVPECTDTLTITGTPVDETGNQRNAPKLTALVREDKPVIWEHDYPSTVKYDYIVESEEKGTWIFTDLKPGKRYYIDFINKGPAGILYSPKAKASWSSEEECTTEPEPGENDDEEASDADSETAEDGDAANDDDTYSDDKPKEKKSSGCSMTVF